MRKGLVKLAIFSCLPFVQMLAQESPMLTGTVEISVTEGTFDCDLTLSEIPFIEDYFIRLNSGMNVLHMRSKEPEDFLIYVNKSLEDHNSTGESSAYFFGDNSGESKFLPTSVQFKYVGKFPVVQDTVENYARTDWKGNIAFNHNSVRVDGLQTAWYPVLYDITNDKVLDKVRYDIEIICSDCNTLYINGGQPVNAQSQRFKSEAPLELAMFCGNYEFQEYQKNFFLNSGLTEQEVEEMGKLMNSYKAFYSKQLRIPFDQPISFIQTTPISKKNGWMFVSFPTIMSIGWQNGLKSIVEPQYQNFYRPFMAHELGHFYFGTYRTFNSELGDMMSEGFAEYMSMILTRNLIGEDVFNDKVEEKIANLKRFSAMPFGKVKAESDYVSRQLYVYNFAPMVFLAMEKELGEEKMWQWLNRLLTAPTKFTNYDFLKSTLKETLKDDKQFNAIKSTYFESKRALANAIKKMKP